MEERRSAQVDPAHLEALRRRLYQPDASDDDRRRFTALDTAVAPAPPQDEEQPAPPHRLLRPAVALAVVAAMGAVLLVSNRPDASTSPSPAVSEAVHAVIAGSEIRRELVVPQPDAPRATSIPTSLAGVQTRLQRFDGRGSAVVTIDTSDAQQVNGTLLVMLRATPERTVEWAATRPTRQPGHSQYVEVVATGVADGPDSLPAYGMHVYDGSPPSRLMVQDRGSGTWTLTVAFLPRRQSEQ